MNPDKRREGEDYADYKDRLKRMREKAKHDAKGTVIWDSPREGTYKKPK